jgi:surfactin synthase thioesterase subunit
MKVVFSHGKESGPWGSKITRLANVAKEQGLRVDSIDYSDILDPDTRVERLLSLWGCEQEQYLLVGSSMGGYVSLVAAEQLTPRGVFQLAPALFMPGYKRQTFSYSSNIDIVHGWSDTVVPPENSLLFAQTTDCSLHLISGDHRLNESIAVVEELFLHFLRRHHRQ